MTKAIHSLFLNIQILHGCGVGLDEILAGLHGIAHQDVEKLVRLLRRRRSSPAS